MRILTLSFQNLNALYGTWHIDFTAPEYIAEGLFALTGPTAAGKSTILDAICLALYGETPRLGKISKDNNEIMSRQTGACFAEVEFETHEGVFRSYWEQHRARNHPEGNLTHPKHELYDALTDKIIESKKTRTLDAIEQKIGMDFKRFTRSILLAQGSFDSFLKANGDDKSKILEQITGVDIYTEISKRTYERQKEEQKELSIIQGQMDNIQLLNTEEEQALQQELSQQKQEKEKYTNQQNTINDAIHWLETIHKLEQELKDFSIQQEILQKNIYAFAPEQNRLSKAMIAADLDGQYATLKAIRAQQAAALQRLEQHQANLPAAQQVFKDSETQQASSRQQLAQANNAQITAAPIIKQVRALDMQLAHIQENITHHAQQIAELQSTITMQKQQQQSKQVNLQSTQQHIAQISQYCTQHAHDALLIEQFSLMEMLFTRLDAQQQEYVKYQAAHAHIQNTSEQTQHLLIQQAKNLPHEYLLDNLSAYKQALLHDQSLHQQIANLEQERNNLMEGQECPLCGATEHPYKQNPIPVDDSTKQILLHIAQQLETLEQYQQYIQQLASHKEQQTHMEVALQETEQSLAKKLQLLHITNIHQENLLNDLRQRKETWQQQHKQQEEHTNTISKLQQELTAIATSIKEKSEIFEQSENKLAELQQQQQEYSTARENLYGILNPDMEEEKLRQATLLAEQKHKEQETQYYASKNTLEKLQDAITALKETTTQDGIKLETLEKNFMAAYQNLGFVDEQDFYAALLPAEQRDALTKQAQSLAQQQTELTTKFSDRNQRLSQEKAKAKTEDSTENLMAQRDHIHHQLEQLQEKIIHLSTKLKSNQQAKEHAQEQQKAIAKQQMEYARWSKLNELIGASDGKKYRTFAQGLTFEQLIIYSNLQLQSMSDRYQLFHDPKQPLELYVIDAYQAGEIRSVKNLSGGESFLMSLALALGLSKMTSQHVRVDSLFLDEGFGTLDEETLHQALDTLSHIQQDGKLIGVISHMRALKERISTQIAITPISGGRSIITGPACRQIR